MAIALAIVVGPDEALARDLWRQVDTLHAAGIAHGDLRSGSVLVDEEMQP